MKSRSTVARLFKFAAPPVKRHRSEVMFAAAQEAIGQKVSGGFVGMGLEPGERRSNDFFGVTMEFGDKGRQEGECAVAQGAKQAPDRDGVGLRRGDQAAHIASVPTQAAVALADFARGGLRRPFFFEAPNVFVDLGFEQGETFYLSSPIRRKERSKSERGS